MVKNENDMTQSETIGKLNVTFQDTLSDRLFDEEKMYTYTKTYANTKNLHQTSKILSFAREAHKGQIRKGKDQVPYINHPLLVACHALALDLDDLPVNEETEAVFYPLLHYAKNEFLMYSNQIFLIKYHLTSVIGTIKHLI